MIGVSFVCFSSPLTTPHPFIFFMSTFDYMVHLDVNRWGPQLEQATYKNRQRLYLSEQASLLISPCDFSCLNVVKFYWK